MGKLRILCATRWRVDTDRAGVRQIDRVDMAACRDLNALGRGALRRILGQDRRVLPDVVVRIARSLINDALDRHAVRNRVAARIRAVERLTEVVSVDRGIHAEGVGAGVHGDRRGELRISAVLVAHEMDGRTLVIAALLPAQSKGREAVDLKAGLQRRHHGFRLCGCSGRSGLAAQALPQGGRGLFLLGRLRLRAHLDRAGARVGRVGHDDRAGRGDVVDLQRIKIGVPLGQRLQSRLVHRQGDGDLPRAAVRLELLAACGAEEADVEGHHAVKAAALVLQSLLRVCVCGVGRSHRAHGQLDRLGKRVLRRVHLDRDAVGGRADAEELGLFYI